MNPWIGAILGTGIGIVSGFVPGLHVNAIALGIAAYSPPNDLGFLALLVCATISQSFSEFVPSILLGAPEESTSLAILPSHRMLLQGKGAIAIQEALNGALLGVGFSIALGFAFIVFARQNISFIQACTPWILAMALSAGFFFERGSRKRVWALGLIALSGFWGYTTLRWSDASIFPLMAGLFGSSQALHSMLFQPNIPEQSILTEPTPIRWKQGLVGTASGSLVALLPGMSASQSIALLNPAMENRSPTQFLSMMGSAVASSSVLGFFTLYAIGKARTGSAAAMQSLTTLQSTDWVWLVSSALFSASIAYWASKIAASRGLNQLKKIPYVSLNAGVLGFTALTCYYFTGTLGLGIWLVSSALGLACISIGCKRTHLMACLMVPTMAWYWGIR